MTIIEVVPKFRAIWQKSGQCKVYQCPVCHEPIFTQYEGNESPVIECEAAAHRLEWPC